MFIVLGITQEGFEKANKLMSNKFCIVLKRNPQDVWVNQYNPDLSRAWNANLDIQYVYMYNRYLWGCSIHCMLYHICQRLNVRWDYCITDIYGAVAYTVCCIIYVKG